MPSILDFLLQRLLDLVGQYFCSKGIADSTQKTYQPAYVHFVNCAILFKVPLSQYQNPCQVIFIISCMSQHLSPQTITTFLTTVRHMQITLGLPELHELSSLPRLKLMQSGIRRSPRPFREPGSTG